MRRLKRLLVLTGLLGCAASPALAQPAMVQCGQQYQAAKTAGTLNGMSWNQYRTDCAARLKAEPASATTPAQAASAPAASAPTAVRTAAPAPAVTAAAPATPPAATTPATGGRAAMLERQKACGAEWRAQKASLVAQTPGLTWPKYWSQCNTRMKAAGR